jgi:hypothetical protein
MKKLRVAKIASDAEAGFRAQRARNVLGARLARER